LSQPGLPSPEAAEDPRLNVGRKAVYASGDFTVNTVLVSLNMVYVFYFLTQVAGLRPELAGAVQLVGRMVDAFTDPWMGRISDRCRWKLGRRRPFFLLGALPLGLSFAALWVVPSGSQMVMFLYYSAWYTLLSIAITVLSVPYLALQPEMALGYDARTSLNTFRNMGSVLGTFAGAVTLRPVANALGGGVEGYAGLGVVYGVMLALPWFGIYRATWERPEFQQRSNESSFLDGVRMLARHQSFRQLTGLYICGRITMDVVGAMLIVYFAHVIGRSDDFELTMGLFLLAVLVSLPVWLSLAPRFEKVTLFRIGAVWWALSLGVLLVAQPDWPRPALLAIAPLGAIGFAMVDLMPWSMLGEVVDEDDLASGERREGIYNGFFMFLRKVAGTIAVFLLGTVLGAMGLEQGEQQSEGTLITIRVLASLVPAGCLLASLWFARNYSLTRDLHTRIRADLLARDQAL
jgi:sugar (glycoside-pentoside-hexuronide) transporter